MNGTAYDFTTPVTEDITLVATWKAHYGINVEVVESTTDYGDDVEITTSYNGKKVTFTASAGFDNYYWYHANSTSSFSTSKNTTVDFTSYLAGDYFITLMAYKDYSVSRVPRTKTVKVTITDTDGE